MGCCESNITGNNKSETMEISLINDQLGEDTVRETPMGEEIVQEKPITSKDLYKPSFTTKENTELREKDQKKNPYFAATTKNEFLQLQNKVQNNSDNEESEEELFLPEAKKLPFGREESELSFGVKGFSFNNSINRHPFCLVSQENSRKYENSFFGSKE